MTVRDDSWYRVQGRLNALENLLMLLVIDRAAIHNDPHAWITQYVAQLRPEKSVTVVGQAPEGVDLNRIAEEAHKAVNEIADQIAKHGEIFRPATTRN